MEIIALCNQKGGCAKTTTTVNLGTCLTEIGKKILLIDNDSQGNLTQSLGVNEYKHTIYSCMIDDISIEEAAMKTQFDDIDIVPADLNYANADMALSNVEGKEVLLKKAFEKSNLDYDYVIIDCSPSLSLTTVNALVCADSVLIPLEASIFNLEGIAQLVKIFKLVKNNYNPGLDVKGVLLTRVDSRSNLHEVFTEQLEEVFGDKLFKTIIHQNIAVVRSQIEKVPLMYYDPTSKAHNEYMELAREVALRVKE